jgi:DNA-binding response OmpR family regulator
MKKILIVDDNEFIVEIMTYILENKGYKVTALNNGEEVFETLKTNYPDLVILDDTLPGLAGRQVCQMLKFNKATQNLPVIMCSASDDIEESLQQQGAPNDVLHKPFDLEALVGKVKMQLAA